MANRDLKITIQELTDDLTVLNSARLTINKEAVETQPSDKFMHNILMAEHSPIRNKLYSIKIENVKLWIATHLLRHHVGVTPYVSTNRDDRTGRPRDEAPQGMLTTIELVLNAQSIISISRKRLCGQAHYETRRVWKEVLKELDKISPILRFYCVPECVRCGFCPEMNPCQADYSAWRQIYIKDRKVLE